MPRAGSRKVDPVAAMHPTMSKIVVTEVHMMPKVRDKACKQIACRINTFVES